MEFVAVDFLESLETIISKLKDICAPVTHAYFTSYVHDDDFRVLREKNVPLFRNFLDAVDAVCPGLQRVSLQTGGKVCFSFWSFAVDEWTEWWELMLTNVVLRGASRSSEGAFGGVVPAV